MLLASLSAARAQQVTAPNLGQAARYGLLSGADIVAGSKKSLLPIRVQGRAGAQGAISKGVQASAGVYAQGGKVVDLALADAQGARDYCTKLGGTILNRKLGGQTLGAGAYLVKADAGISPGASLTLTGDTATIIVLNIDGSLELEPQARVVLDGVRPEHVFWNVVTDLTVAAGASFSGVALTGGGATLTGSQFGRCALLSQQAIMLTDLSALVGHNQFFAAARPAGTCLAGGPTTSCAPYILPGSELVQDGSFEEYSCLPSDYSGLFLGSLACFWDSGTAGRSADYYHTGAGTNVSVPMNDPSGADPIPAMAQNSLTQEGEAYAGIIAFEYTITNTVNYREYVAQQGTAVLSPAHHYYAGFATRSATRAGYQVKMLGLAVLAASPSLPVAGTFNSLLPVPAAAPFITKSIGTSPVVGPDNGWRWISGVFSPSVTMSGFTVVVGNFLRRSANIIGGGNSTGGEVANRAYYYIDNVTLSMVTEANGPQTPATTCGQTNVTLGTLPMPALVGATYAWTASPATSSPIPGIANPTVMPTQTTTYTLTVTIPGQAQSYTTTVTVTVVPPPAMPAFTAQTSCGGLVTASLTGPTTPGTTYIWNWGDGPSTTTGSGPHTHQYTANGTYPITVTATNGQGCATTATQQVTITLPPATPTFTVQTNCNGVVTASLTGPTTPGTTYVWNWGDGPSTTTGSGPHTHQYTASGTYPITVTATNGQGCATTATQQVTIGPPPATPAFTVQADCSGLATASLTGPTTPGTTYQWNWGDNTGPLTGPGPYDHQYQASGTYTVTITATNGQGCATTATQQVTISPGSCCPLNVPVANWLGQPGQTTTLTGGATYSGTYRVRGDVLLTNGTYTLAPGTTFYVDGEATRLPTAGGVDERDVRGCTITLGNGARLVLDAATITSSGGTATCPMWRGIVVDGYLPLNSPTQVIVSNGSVISHAYCALTVTRQSVTSNGVAYSLTNSSFLHNLTHVLDMGIRKRGSGPNHPGGAALIQNCTFDADPALMHYPYNATTATDQYVTYQALQLLPENDPGSDADAVQVAGNTISHAIYGIVNNVPNSFEGHDVLIRNNSLSDIYQTGIWAVDNQALPQGGLAAGTVSRNTVTLSDWGGLVTEQLSATNLRIGLSNESSQLVYNANAFRDNRVYGQVGGTRPQVGLNLYYQVEASGNALVNLEEGIRTTALSQGRVFDNHATDCGSGVTVQSSFPYGYDAQIGCNTFERNNSLDFLRGIYVLRYAEFNDQGDPGAPAGNAFTRLNESVRNEGITAITYHRTSSAREYVDNPIIGGGSGTPQISPVSPVDYCSVTRQATNNNGINQRGTVPSPDYLAALADTVRRQLVPRARRRAYLGVVLHYHLAQGQLAGLDAWWATLLPGNVEDYCTTGLTLLAAYDQQPTTAAAAGAQRVLAALQPQAALDANLAAGLALRLVERHLPQTAPRLTAADSTQLQALAWSGTPTAGRAGRWLRYFHPRVALPAAAGPDPLRPAARLAAAQPVKTALPAQLGEAYPNPAHTQVSIACQLPAGATGGVLLFTDLVTGRTVREVPVPAGEQAKPLLVSISELAAGPYAYRLLVNGRPVSGARKLLVLP